MELRNMQIFVPKELQNVYILIHNEPTKAQNTTSAIRDKAVADRCPVSGRWEKSYTRASLFFRRYD